MDRSKKLKLVFSYEGNESKSYTSSIFNKECIIKAIDLRANHQDGMIITIDHHEDITYKLNVEMFCDIIEPKYGPIEPKETRLILTYKATGRQE